MSFINTKFWKAIITIAFLSFAYLSFCQNQNSADSLIVLLENNNFSGEKLIEILHGIASNHTIVEEKIKYANRLIEESKNQENQFWLHKGLMELGSGYKRKGDLNLALDAYIKSNEAAKGAEYIEGEGGSLAMIADIYSINGNSLNAMEYYDRSLDILSRTQDSLKYATVLLNAGDEFVNSSKYKQALIYFNESGAIFKKLGYLIGTAYNLGNSGMAHAELGNKDLAEKNIIEAIDILEKLEDYYPISVYLTYMSDIYLEKGDRAAALKYAQRSLDLAQTYGLKDQISEANLQLSDLHNQFGNYREAFNYYKNFIVFRDSVTNIQSVQGMANLRTDFEVSQKQTEVDLLNQQKKNQQITMLSTILVAVLLAMLAFGLYRRYRFIDKTKKIIEEEKKRSDDLLLNILPEETANELKANGKVVGKKFDSATIMFTDFKGFTSYAEKLSPENLVETIDYYFSNFDRIIDKYNIEKIKTVGDAYMCACGLPKPTEDHAAEIVMASLEIVDFVEKTKVSSNEFDFDIRIGIHTGPVVAGIVGTKKFAYDIWGDTVNIASRMESNSEPGKVNISENTYQLIKEKFACSYRGEMAVKNRKEKIKMYFVSGPSESFAKKNKLQSQSFS